MNAILKKAEAYVRTLLNDDALKGYKYHTMEHTEDVVEECKKLAAESALTDDDLEIVLLAAWFHDTGYTRGRQDHEAKSELIAREFLQKVNYDKEKTEKVCQCIRDTKVPQTPQNPLSKILCDADMSGLGSASYWKKSKKLRKEMAKLEGRDYEDREWVEGEITFLTNHHYFTPAAHKLYDDQKKRNIAELKDRQNGAVQIPDELLAQEGAVPKAKEKKKDYGRGVETMFRTSAQTHINLSTLADNKANIMLSINALIISVVLSVLLPKLDSPSNAHLVIPTIILLATCVLTIVFATLSTKPKVTNGKFNKEDIEQKRSNLLFFGNFYNMELKDYEWGVGEMIKDRDFLYGSLTRDLYFLGKVLAEKYSYLRICFTIFMYGLIISVIAFGVALAIHDLSAPPPA